MYPDCLRQGHSALHDLSLDASDMLLYTLRGYGSLAGWVGGGVFMVICVLCSIVGRVSAWAIRIADLKLQVWQPADYRCCIQVLIC